MGSFVLIGSFFDNLFAPNASPKYYSTTRPTHLPPKKREEEDKHLKEHESMIKRYKEKGITSSYLILEKLKKMQKKKMVMRKEKEIEMNIDRWLTKILPKWDKYLLSYKITIG